MSAFRLFLVLGFLLALTALLWLPHSAVLGPLAPLVGLLLVVGSLVAVAAYASRSSSSVSS